MSDYQRVAKAIAYLIDRVGEQPSLEEVAAQVHLSPAHFQRLFSRWVGITPKRFLQVLTLERGKRLMLEPGSLLDVAGASGLSSSSRLYDHFVTLEAMTPGEYRRGGEGLTIDYGVHATSFGSLFLAATERGVCRAAFLDDTDGEEQLALVRACWPKARLISNPGVTEALVATMFERKPTSEKPLSLYVSGTNFQVMVWRALLRIPPGRVISYSQLAAALGNPKATRAVAGAVAANPVAFTIPCHRVIQQSGALGGYRWGPVRKQAMHLWENAHYSESEDEPLPDRVRSTLD
ncbi:methylated-DNA--[protein]-cysteine S-methyltransferase [Marinimicrobium sp. ABcell2]|uniref:methylated-DNA--[protein]-cysteine S-methyltransferase n=1 Tax=Marinimicrobium sp. ABcell2 TaxID=3069751 RepID=UPI0027B83DED|nr:methylated-DNA--[protein]-cysteine S-methyltransferase [Marinimicrobium sp. ABcell2]MDQ2076479.1 methylated-DNA--[protein]-cysteine S-methyltransferase [Marinimicrobium sp. ABcell2]